MTARLDERPPLRSSKRDADRVARKLRRAARVALPLPPLPPRIPAFDAEGFEEDEAPRAVRFAPWTPDSEGPPPSSSEDGPPTEETGPPSFASLAPVSRAPRSLTERIFSSYPTEPRVIETYSLPPSGPPSQRARASGGSMAPVSRRAAAWSERGEPPEAPVSVAPISRRSGPPSVRSRRGRAFAVPVLRPREGSPNGLRRATAEELELAKKGVRRPHRRRLRFVAEGVPNLLRTILTRRGFQWLGALLLVAITAYLVGRAFVAAAKPDPKAFAPIFLETEEKILWGPHTVWLPDVGDVGRPMDRWNRGSLQRGYEAAWRQLFEAKRSVRPIALEREFAPPALRGAEDSVAGAHASAYTTDEVALEHALELHQYTYDGRVAHVRDRCLRAAFVVRDRTSGATVGRGSDEGSFDALLRLEDGYWKISDLKRLGPANCPVRAPLAQLPVAPVRVVGARFVDAGGEVAVRGINDVRVGLAGSDFVRNRALTKPDAEPPDPLPKVAEDLARLGAAGVKFVRIPIHFEGAGGGVPTETALDRLARTLDVAGRHGLRVLFSLFGGRRNVDLALWPEVDRHLEAILGTFRRHPALFGWDLMNGPDAEFLVQPKEDVVAFLRFLAGRAAVYDPEHPRTISWRGPDHACLLADALTFVAYTDFGTPATVAQHLHEVRARCGEKPVVLTEFGFRGRPAEEGLQAAFFHAFARGLGEQPFYGFVWALGDVDAPPDDAPRGEEKRRGESFGLFRANNRAKPAWFAVRQEFFAP